MLKFKGVSNSKTNFAVSWQEQALGTVEIIGKKWNAKLPSGRIVAEQMNSRDQAADTLINLYLPS